MTTRGKQNVPLPVSLIGEGAPMREMLKLVALEPMARLTKMYGVARWWRARFREPPVSGQRVRFVLEMDWLTPAPMR